MDINKYLEPEFDYSRINLEEFQWMGGITFSEIEQVYRNPSTRFYDRSYPPSKRNRWDCIGFTDGSRCLELAFEYNDANGKISFILINPPTEYGIEQYWCRRGKARP